MSQRVVGAQQTIAVRYRLHILVEHLLGIHYRTNLEQIELAGLVGVDIAGELDFHRATHRLASKLHRHLKNLRQWDDIMLEHTGKGNHLASILIYAVVQYLVVGIECGGDVVERAIGYGILHLHLEDVESIVHLKVLAHVLHVEGIELGLRLAQRLVHLGSLEHLVRMIRTNSQGLTSIHDILAQSERQTSDTLLCRLVAYRIIIERTKHTTHVRVEMVAIGLANHLLKDDRHLFLVDDVASGSHVSLGIAIEHRGIDALDGTSQHL